MAHKISDSLYMTHYTHEYVWVSVLLKVLYTIMIMSYLSTISWRIGSVTHYIWLILHTNMRESACYTRCTIYNHDTGWRRRTGCLKLQVIFCKRAIHYRALLQKMTYKDKPSHASSPPCTTICRQFHGAQHQWWCATVVCRQNAQRLARY